MDASPDDRFDDRTNATNLRTARALGLFSLGLGAASMLAPSRVARAIGVDEGGNERVIRAVGFREIAQGLSLLWATEPAPFLWSRVAGDALDLSLLARAYASRADDDDRRRRIARAMVGVVGVAVPDVIASVRASGATDGVGRVRSDAEVRASITVRRSPEEVYDLWRGLTNLPRFMTHLESVVDAGGGRTRWRANGPGGTVVEWEAVITDDEPNERIAWASVEGSQIENSGSVEFVSAPRDQGTQVRLRLSYAPPGGGAGRVVAKLLGEEPKQQASDDLRRFKQLMEAGEVVRSEGTPEGIRTTRMLAQRPAQPMAA